MAYPLGWSSSPRTTGDRMETLVEPYHEYPKLPKRAHTHPPTPTHTHTHTHTHAPAHSLPGGRLNTHIHTHTPRDRSKAPGLIDRRKANQTTPDRGTRGSATKGAGFRRTDRSDARHQNHRHRLGARGCTEKIASMFSKESSGVREMLLEHL